MTLWNNDTEIQFFTEALKNFASPEQLFYNLIDEKLNLQKTTWQIIKIEYFYNY